MLNQNRSVFRTQSKIFIRTDSGLPLKKWTIFIYSSVLSKYGVNLTFTTRQALSRMKVVVEKEEKSYWFIKHWLKH